MRLATVGGAQPDDTIINGFAVALTVICGALAAPGPLVSATPKAAPISSLPTASATPGAR